MSILDSIGLGSILGGGDDSGGLLGSALDLSGIPQLVERVVIIYVGIELLFRLVDKIGN